MPILRISTGEEDARLHGAVAPLLPTLRHALAADPGPVTVMIHGYKYLPGHPRFCPHRSLLAPKPSITGPRIISWPRRLGLRGQHGEGLGISFGWSARGSIWDAATTAYDAGRQLGRLLDRITTLAPERPIHLVAHSLGARVALEAIRGTASDTVRRAILLAGAEFRETARAALQSPGGRACHLLNVTSRENDLYDFLFERLVAPAQTGDRVLGNGGLALPNAVTLQLDDANSLASLRVAGFIIGAPQSRVCHWSPYLRAGVFPFYRAFLSGRLDAQSLQTMLPEQTAPRWSRLRPTFPSLPLPIQLAPR